MADSNITQWEYSTQDGQPVECYRFSHAGMSYLYTSNSVDVEIPIVDEGAQRTEHYTADYIERQNIKPSSRGDSAALVVTVSKDNPVAKLFQGPPPERPVVLELYRLHDQDHMKLDKIFFGKVAQASFDGSDCQLTVKLENWLSKEIPNKMRQFFCGNALFDGDCRLRVEDWQIAAFVDEVSGLKVRSSTFGQYPDGYFTRGFLTYGENIRLIRDHAGDKITLQYPFATPPRHDVVVAPGCDSLFRTCVVKFHNHLNFSGCPYVPPIDPTKKQVGQGVYWVDSQVVQRDSQGFVGTISM